MTLPALPPLGDTSWYDWAQSVHNSTVGAHANVRDYGAVGDYSTDDTAAFVAALATGLPVYVPSGKYSINQITLPNHVVIYGDAIPAFDDGVMPMSILYLRAAQNSHMLHVPVGSRFGRIENLLLAGQSHNQTGGTGCGVHIEDNPDPGGEESQLTLHNVSVVNCVADGLYVGVRRRAVRVLGRSNFLDNKRNGITLAGSDNLLIGPLVGSNTQYGIDVQAAINKIVGADVWMSTVGIRFGVESEGSNVHASGLDQHQQHAILMEGWNGNAVVGCRFASNGLAATNTYDHISVASGVRHAIVGNVFGSRADPATMANVRHCVYLAPGAFAAIAGNLPSEGETGSGFSNRENHETLTGTGTITPDPYMGEAKGITLTGNVTIANPTRYHVGQRLTFLFTQDATGSRTVTFGNQFRTRSGFAVTATASSSTGASFIRTGSLWVQV